MTAPPSTAYLLYMDTIYRRNGGGATGAAAAVAAGGYGAGVDFRPALAEAIAAGDAAALADLFAAGADPASADEDEDDPFLLVAASTGDVELARVFLDAGLPVDTEDRYGTTALIAAALDGHLPLAEFLLARGADPDRAQLGSGESGTALTWAMGRPDAAAWVELAASPVPTRTCPARTAGPPDAGPLIRPRGTRAPAARRRCGCACRCPRRRAQRAQRRPAPQP